MRENLQYCSSETYTDERTLINVELFALNHKEKTTHHIIEVIPGYFAFICDVTSKSVFLTLRMAIADPYIVTNDQRP